jgi:hypothetical protein
MRTAVCCAALPGHWFWHAAFTKIREASWPIVWPHVAARVRVSHSNDELVRRLTPVFKRDRRKKRSSRKNRRASHIPSYRLALSFSRSTPLHLIEQDWRPRQMRAPYDLVTCVDPTINFPERPSLQKAFPLKPPAFGPTASFSRWAIAFGAADMRSAR